MNKSGRQYMSPNIGVFGHEVSGVRLLSQEECNKIIDEAIGQRWYIEKVKSLIGRAKERILQRTRYLFRD